MAALSIASPPIRPFARTCPDRGYGRIAPVPRRWMKIHAKQADTVEKVKSSCVQLSAKSAVQPIVRSLTIRSLDGCGRRAAFLLGARDVPVSLPVAEEGL